MTKREGWMGIPAAALAALPVCPACYPAYLAVLSGLGLGALESFEAQLTITALFLAVALGALAYRARQRRGLAPLAVGAFGATVVLVSKLLLGIEAGTYAGVALLVVASVWNVWPRAGATCEIESAAQPDGASG